MSSRSFDFLFYLNILIFIPISNTMVDSRVRSTYHYVQWFLSPSKINLFPYGRICSESTKFVKEVNKQFETISFKLWLFISRVIYRYWVTWTWSSGRPNSYVWVIIHIPTTLVETQQHLFREMDSKVYLYGCLTNYISTKWKPIYL